jgi:hypothetical protein
MGHFSHYIGYSGVYQSAYSSIAMEKIWIPEAIIILFLVLPLLRPFFKKLWPLEGLAWLPLVALGITIGLFPAYGFRPECLPMLVFVIVYNIANISSLRSRDTFRDRGPFLTIVAFILLNVVAIPMFAFSSSIEPRPEELGFVKVMKLSDRAYDKDFSLRIYGEARADRPLIFIVPPELGSVDSVELVCTDLQKKGFTVITYSSRSYDSFTKKPRYWSVFRRGTTSASANKHGKALENERQAEIEFLLSRLPGVIQQEGNGNVPPLLLAGYGAGGSALAYLAGESGFMSRYSNVKGVVAIESRLWSSYYPQPRNTIDIPYNANIVRRFTSELVNRLINLLPRRVSFTGPLPSAGLPILFLVSDKAMGTFKGQKPYQAVLASFNTGSGPSAFAAIEGAGSLDYQDFPITHPVYSFLLPGLKTSQKSENPVSDTSGIISNFAHYVLETNAPPRYALSGKLHLESKALPHLRL